MIIYVDPTTEPATVRLDEPDDCKRFHVALAGTDAAALARALNESGVGRVDGEHAFIHVDAIRRMAEGRVDEDWESQFASMLEFAASKGWLDESGTAIQAHVESSA